MLGSFVPTEIVYPFPIWQSLDSSKLEELADQNFNCENGGKFSEGVENTGGEKKKLLNLSNFSFSNRVFKTWSADT